MSFRRSFIIITFFCLFVIDYLNSINDNDGDDHDDGDDDVDQRLTNLIKEACTKLK